jgi:hypothetical protein
MNFILEFFISKSITENVAANWFPVDVQVWYCTSSRSHTTIAKYAEYLATSYKEAKENLGKDFSVNPKVRSKKFFFFAVLLIPHSPNSDPDPDPRVLVNPDLDPVLFSGKNCKHIQRNKVIFDNKGNLFS